MPQPLRLLLLLLLGLLAACSTRPEEALPPPAQTTQAVQVAPDTAAAPPSSIGRTSAAVDRAGSSAAPDSLMAAVQSLQAEVRSLRASNDSLRVTLGTLARVASDTDRAAAGDEAVLDRARERVRSYAPRVLMAVLVLVVTYLLIRGAVWLLDVLAEQRAQHRLFYKRLVPIARILLWAVAIWFITRAIFGIEAQDLVVAAAALGVAIGFAAQDILKNIFGGLVIIFDQPFQVGDKVAVGGSYGEVVSIGLRSTRLTTPDDNLVSVPNAQVVDGQVSNANAGALDCQVVTDLYLPGWVDEAQAKRLAYEAAASSKYVYLDKPIVVIVKDEFEQTFVTHLKVKAYVLDTRYEFLLMSDVTERARAAFRKAGLLQPLHGARAFLDLSGLRPGNGHDDAPAPSSADDA